MDGASVCRALRELGYEGALRREAFDWLASMPNARVRGVVEWLASLGPDCSVVRQMTPLQRKTYQELQARGHVLRGEGLREAWERLTSAAALLSADELRAELDRARQDVAELERRLKKSVQRRNAVRRAQGGERERATVETRSRRQAALQELERAHASADRAVDGLEEEIVALATRCGAAVQSFAGADDSTHLHARLVTSGHARYDAADQKGLHALAAFVDRQFDAARGPMHRLQAEEGLREGNGDPATLPAPTPQPALLAAHDADGAAARDGPSVHHQLHRCRHLLQAVRGIATRAAQAGASARAMRARAEIAASLCAQRRRRLAELSLLDDVTVRQHIRDEEAAAEAAERREAAALLRVEALARRRGETEGGDILVGDYRSKRARQQRYLSRQATILRFVAEQQARHRLLLAAYTAEQHTLAETQHACTTAARAVQALSGGAHARARRTAALRRQGGALASAYRHSVDGRDLFARSIAAAASDAAATAAGAGGSGADTPGGSRARHEGAAGTGDASDGAQVGRADGGGDGGTWAVGETWEALQERVQALAGKGSAHQGPSSGRRREEAVGSAVGHARRLWAETGLGRAAGVGDERSWTLARDPALCAALEGADARRRQLSVEVSRVLETHAQREEKIRRDPVLMKGLRAMFVHFHMRPERLQREEAALKERIAGAGQR